MNTENQLIKDIKTYAEMMKLGVIKSNIEESIADANANNLSYEQFLYGLLQKECDIKNYLQLCLFLLHN